MARTRKGRDVYVMGAANVGKSSFIRALVREMGNMQSASFSPGAIAASKRQPTVSSMPGTTLGTIPLRVFDDNRGTLYDTAGLHLHHRLNNMLSPDDLKALHPRRRLNPYISVLSGDGLRAAKFERMARMKNSDQRQKDNGDIEDISNYYLSSRLEMENQPMRYKWGALVSD